MKVPTLGQLFINIITAVFPSSKAWRNVVALVGFAVGLFIAYVKLSARSSS